MQSFPRRSFLRLTAAAAPTLAFNPIDHLLGRGADLLAAPEVVIIGGGVGGCAAALAACRAGRQVLLTEETDWIGGQLTSQAVPPDEHPWIESFGCTRSYRQFRDGVREFYRRHFPLTAEAAANGRLNPGNGSVSRLCHEPRVAWAVLQQMLAPYVASGRLQIWLETVAIAAQVDGDRVRAVILENRRAGRRFTIEAPFFVDATELGDLLPLTQTEFVVGAEGQKETEEPHAPPEANPRAQQAITCCFAVDYVAGEDHTIERPAEYDFWRGYVPQMEPAWPGPLLSWQMSDPITLQPRKVSFDPTAPGPGGLNLFLYRRIADAGNYTAGTYRSGISLINWPQNDYWLAPLIGGTPEEAARQVARARQLSLSLLYWMQTEAPRPDGGQGWKGLRLRPDVVGTVDGLAKQPYIREARRIRAEFTVREMDLSTEARMRATGKAREDVTAAAYSDSVGVGAYRIDLHPDTAGRNYVDLSSLPFQIPLGALLPKRIENLLPAAKNLGTTHITNGCYRLHPVEWNIGEAVGALVAFCRDCGEPPRQVRRDPKRLAEFQQRLRQQGLELEWPRLRPL